MSLSATPNLPSRDFAKSVEFYARLGFYERFRDEGWMILGRDNAVIEFFPHPRLDPKESWFSACLRTEAPGALDSIFASLALAELPERGIPRLTPPCDITPGLRMLP
ncbi:bleomycin resistance protein [Paracoccus suum]|uniref:bleomycin resistance protein n=1 Tax=Paracoccus suum TaxID=2259340 RepID=UPI002680BE9C